MQREDLRNGSLRNAADALEVQRAWAFRLEVSTSFNEALQVR